MLRTILALIAELALLSITPTAEADKGGNKWKGPPPRGNAWGHYKQAWNPGWPDYWYAGSPYFAPPPQYYHWPAPVNSLPRGYAPAFPPLPEPLPPPPPPP